MRRLHEAEFGEIADLVGKDSETLALRHGGADRHSLEHVAQDRIRDRGAALFDHLHRDERCDAAGVGDHHGLVSLLALGFLRTGDEEPFAVLERERFAHLDRPAARLQRLVGEAFLDIRIGVGGELGERDQRARKRILEARKPGARRKAGWCGQPDTRSGRKHRIGRIGGCRRTRASANRACRKICRGSMEYPYGSRRLSRRFAYTPATWATMRPAEGRGRAASDRMAGRRGRSMTSPTPRRRPGHFEARLWLHGLKGAIRRAGTRYFRPPCRRRKDTCGGRRRNPHGRLTPADPAYGLRQRRPDFQIRRPLPKCSGLAGIPCEDSTAVFRRLLSLPD